MNGSQRTSSDEYRANDGSGGYGTIGGYRTSSGAYRAGGHRPASGSHRVVAGERRWGWRMALVLFGAVAGVAACALVVVLIMYRASSPLTTRPNRVAVQNQSSSNSGNNSKELPIVPDSCSLLTSQQATALVPGFQQNPSTASDTDQHSQCAWTDFSAGSGRQLTVELRAIAAAGGQSATATAHTTFQNEESGDVSGKNGLSTSQTIAAHQPISGLGDEAYLVYSQDSSQAYGDAGVNVRVANLLVTVHFGGASDGSPLDQQKAADGAKEATKHILEALAAQH